MATFNALARLYGGAAFTPSAARQFGANVASADYASAQDRRRRLLTQAVQKGSIAPEQLGTFDRALLGLAGGAPHGVADHSGFLGHVGGFISHLGGDIKSFGAHFGPGVYEFLKTGIYDPVVHGYAKGGLTAQPFYKKIIAPTGQAYSQTYGHGNILSNIYEHPLGPILDVATLASLGLGGTARAGGAMARASEFGSPAHVRGLKLARLTSPEGRAPLPGLPGIEREFSTQPLRQIAQRVTDIAGRYSPRVAAVQRMGLTKGFGTGGLIPSFTSKFAAKQSAAEAANIDAAVRPLGNVMKGLDQDEQQALMLNLIGANTPERLEAFQVSVRKTLKNEHPAGEGMNFNELEPLGVTRSYLERQAFLNPRVREHVLDPTQGMERSAEAWAADVARGHGQLEYTPEMQTEHLAEREQQLFGRGQPTIPNEAVARYQGLAAQGLHFPEGTASTDPFDLIVKGQDDQALQELRALEQQYPGISHAAFPEGEAPQGVIPGAENPRIAPNYVPAQLASGFEERAPGRIGSALGRKSRVARESRDRKLSPSGITAQNLLSDPMPRYLHKSMGTTLRSGAFRTDARALLDHAAQRERDMVQRAFNPELLRKFEAKDAEGNVIKGKTTSDGRPALHAAGLNPDDYVLVHEQFPIQWYRGQTDFIERVLHTVEALRKEGATEINPAIETHLEQLANDHAEAFVKSHWGAIKREGTYVPRDFFDYQRAIAGVNDPFNNPFGSFYARMMHRWRNLTLAYMPRWALNTAAGSFLLAMTKGIMPHDYHEASKLARSYVDTDGKVHVRPTLIQRRALGHEDLNVQGMEPLLPPGVRLANLAPSDFLEPGGLGYADIGDVKFPTREIYRRVQGIEDHFRMAGFVQSLREHAKIQMRTIGEDLKSFYGELSDKPMIEQWLADPKLVQRAIDDVNKFSYSYGELSPFERRFVRQAIPFWGWYKFITKFAWRLPVDNPGRARIIQAFSNVGAEAENELGTMPDWIRGSIMLNMVGSKLHYMTSMGINPLAQFANPARGFGGIVQMSQGSPAIQAILAGMGIDTLRLSQSPISPQSGVGPGTFGQQVDLKTGEQVNPSFKASLPRFIGSLLRTIPEYRTAERFAAGGAVYPENILGVYSRPMPPTKSTTVPNFGEQVILPTLGINLKTYDLRGHQALIRKQRTAAIKAAKRDIAKIRAHH